MELPHPLVFGGPSHTWDGGPAYLDLERAGRSVGRAWRITHQQFEDVVAQENKLDPGTVQVAPSLLTAGGVLLPEARYGRLVALDPIEQVPAVTFTYVRRPRERPPDPQYVALLQDGLREVGLSPAEAATLLADQPQLSMTDVQGGVLGESST